MRGFRRSNRFVLDSPLEQAGFELYVPPPHSVPAAWGGAGASGSATGPTPPSRSPKRRLFASTNLATQFPGMPGAPSHGQNRLLARDRLRRLRASGGALFAFSAKTRSSGPTRRADGTVNLSVRLSRCTRLAMALEIYWQPVLQISAQTWNVWALEALCLGGSDMIPAEVEQVIDLIVG